MWTLTQGWSSVGSGKASEPYDSEEPIGPSEVLSPADQEYSTVDKEPESISEDSSHTPDEHSGVVKRTTFELAVSRVVYALQMRRITEFLSRYIFRRACHVHLKCAQFTPVRINRKLSTIETVFVLISAHEKLWRCATRNSFGRYLSVSRFLRANHTSSHGLHGGSQTDGHPT